MSNMFFAHGDPIYRGSNLRDVFQKNENWFLAGQTGTERFFGETRRFGRTLVWVNMTFDVTPKTPNSENAVISGKRYPIKFLIQYTKSVMETNIYD